MILKKITASCHLRIEDNTPLVTYISTINSRLHCTCNADRFHICITDMNADELTIAVVYNHRVSPREFLDCISDILGNEICFRDQSELTIEEYSMLLSRANQRELLDRPPDSVLRHLRLMIKAKMYAFESPSYVINERIAIPAKSQKETRKKLSDVLASQSFYEEIDRINAKENLRSFFGHPVHYYITSSAKAAADDIIDVLVPELLKTSRLLSGRICDISKITYSFHNSDHFENIFFAAQGATVVINLAVEPDEGIYASGLHELAEKLGEQLQKYGNSTLFIFVDISGNQTMSNDIIANLLAKADMIDTYR